MRRPRRRTPRAPRRRAECVLPRRLLEQYHGLRETGEGAWRYAVARTATPQEGVGRLRPVTEDAGRRIKNRDRGCRGAAPGAKLRPEPTTWEVVHEPGPPSLPARHGRRRRGRRPWWTGPNSARCWWVAAR